MIGTRLCLLLSIILLNLFWYFQIWTSYSAGEADVRIVPKRQEDSGQLYHALKLEIEPSKSAEQFYNVFSRETLRTLPAIITNYKVRPVKAREHPQKLAGEARYKACVESLKPFVAGISQTVSNTAHERLAIEFGILAIEASCRSSRRYWLKGLPHFEGGRDQYTRYLASRGWEKIKSKILPEDLPKSTVLALVWCKTVSPTQDMLRNGTVQLVSTSPQERERAQKYSFFLATKALFDQNKCDYRKFYPETHVVNSQETCKQMVNHIKEENTPDRIWFLKFPIVSFGRGIVIRKADEALENELANCEQYGTSSTNASRVLFQHGVENIFKYEGRYTQGRAYILISNYDPATAWFFMGYFNVAGVSSDASAKTSVSDAKSDSNQQENSLGGNMQVNKAAFVTNLQSNQQSKRLFFHELMEGKSREEITSTYHNIKRAALTTYLALKPTLTKAGGSFSLIGFDYLIQTDFGVKVIETNCNCELFYNVSEFGKERVMSSTVLMDGMMDIVLASNLIPQESGDLLKKRLETDDKRFKDAKEAFKAGGSRYPGTGSWELIYSKLLNLLFNTQMYLRMLVEE